MARNQWEAAQDTIDAVTAQLVSEYATDDRPTELDLAELDHVWPADGKWH